MFKDFKPELDSLDPKVREKVLEIAGQLVSEKNYTKKKGYC